MLPGFSTNSIGTTDPVAAIPFLAELGYRSLAITLDRGTLDPFAGGLDGAIETWRRAIESAGMACIIETGARHLLDPLRKHEPTLVSSGAADRLRRGAFLTHAVDICRRLGGGCVSLWSGIGRDDADESTLWRRLVEALSPVLEQASQAGVPLAFEPEPGMFVDTLARFEELLDRTGRPAHLLLTVDTGHLGCMGERPAQRWLAAHADRVANVHVDDATACRHEHLSLGAGEVGFPELFTTLSAAGYRAGLHVELPRQAHRWSETAKEAIAFLKRLPTLRLG